ncbi:MAG: S8 family serine peptidase [Candidatus Bipolaricaulota bacterium]|nr:S8 family serine peptidase [Candidatus Bipolaricaulota bacterium]
MRGLRNYNLRWAILAIGLFLSVMSSSSPGGVGTTAWSSIPCPVEGSADSWALKRINESSILKQDLLGEGVIVAVIDTGIDFSSVSGALPWTAPGEIMGNGVDDDQNDYVDDIHGWNFYSTTPIGSNPMLGHWHGTFVAGLIGDKCFGVAPNVTLMDLRVTDARGRIESWEAIMDAIHYAVDNGAEIINLSLTFNSPPPESVLSALEYAQKHDVVVIGSAGNSGNEVMFPARLRNVWAISATGRDDTIAAFSSRGSAVALAAPGMDVPSLLPNGRYAVASGTSFAAAYVSGAMAVLASSRRGSHMDQLRILQESAVDLGDPGADPLYGWGRIDLTRAVRSLAKIAP